MKQHRANLIAIAIILGPACDGLDPDSFAPSAPARQMGGQAGYHYASGAGGGGGGGGGRGSSGTGGASASAANRAGSSSGGEGSAGVDGQPGGDEDADAGDGGGPMHPPGGGGATNGNGGAGAIAATGGTQENVSGQGGAGAEGPSGAGGDASQAGGTAGMTGGSAGSGQSARSLLVSEYVEGSGSYKAIELHAVGESRLDGCRLVTYSNGSSTGSGISLTGTVPALGTYTLCSSSLASQLGDTCDRTTSLSFNGNDAVSLECDGELIHVLGQVGFDPGSGWVGVNASTLNMTLRRRCDAEGLDADGTDAFDPDAGWLPLPTDTFDGLGDPTCG